MLDQGEFSLGEGENSGGVDPWGWVFTWMPLVNPGFQRQRIWDVTGGGSGEVLRRICVASSQDGPIDEGRNGDYSSNVCLLSTLHQKSWALGEDTVNKRARSLPFVVCVPRTFPEDKIGGKASKLMSALCQMVAVR